MKRTGKGKPPRGALTGAAGLEKHTLEQYIESARLRGVLSASGGLVAEKVKRHIILCPGCGCIEEVRRSDTLTCSPACRVRAHRSGAAAKVRDLAREAHVPPSLIVRAQALEAMRDDQGELIKQARRCDVDIHDDNTKYQIHRALCALLMLMVDADTSRKNR